MSATKAINEHKKKVLPKAEAGGRHQVVIIGGGFGGLYAAKELAGAPLEITLIDRRNFHLFQPLLYQVATGELSPADISSPLRTVLKRHLNCRVINDEAVDIDPASQTVHLKNGRIEYNSLIIATGTENNFFGNDSVKEKAIGLKSIEDALAIRKRIFTAFEQAEQTADAREQRKLLTFVIVGGGPTGVELAGAMAELAYKTLKNEYRRFNSSRVRILLVEGGAALLPTYAKSLQDNARRRLTGLGVKVKTKTFVTGIDDDIVHLKNKKGESTIEAASVIWAAGVKPTGMSKILFDRIGCQLDNFGRVIVDDNLNIGKQKNVFVIGDLAHFSLQGEALPGVASVAMAEGRYVARFIKRRLKSKKTAPFRYIDRGNLAVIGRNAAVADFGRLRIRGFLAWIIWIFVHIAYLIEFDNKLVVLIQWAWNYFTGNKGARLITYND